MPHIANATDFAAHFDVSRETLEKLETYAALLTKWQKAINLVAKSTLDDVWHRHMADSAQIVRLAPGTPANAPPSSWLDLGSGAGFPGLVAAIMRAENQPEDAVAAVTLIESDTRKCAFLREVARHVHIPVDIIEQRIEADTTRAKIQGVKVVSARALAPLDKLFGYAHPYAAAEATYLFPKGRKAAEEIEAAQSDWRFEYDLVPSITDAEGTIVVARNVSPR